MTSSRIGDAAKNRSDAARKSGRRTAESRKCPACARKSATKFHTDESGFGMVCRWCGWTNYQLRDTT